MEIHNGPADVVDQMYKLASINLSPNVPGQVALGIMLNPPKPGEESHSLWEEERKEILLSLGRRAKAITDALNTLPGVSCVSAGSLYAFPRIEIPPRAIQAAAESNMAPDVLYCLELLKSTGIATTPGSGFGQKDGTFHFRTTILVQESKLEMFIKELCRFHNEFLTKYGGAGFAAKL